MPNFVSWAELSCFKKNTRLVLICFNKGSFLAHISLLETPKHGPKDVPLLLWAARAGTYRWTSFVPQLHTSFTTSTWSPQQRSKTYIKNCRANGSGGHCILWDPKHWCLEVQPCKRSSCFLRKKGSWIYHDLSVRSFPCATPSVAERTGKLLQGFSSESGSRCNHWEVIDVHLF